MQVQSKNQYNLYFEKTKHTHTLTHKHKKREYAEHIVLMKFREREREEKKENNFKCFRVFMHTCPYVTSIMNKERKSYSKPDSV